MKRTFALVAATAMSLAPAMALAQPAPGSISPNHETGQQVGGEDGLECDEGGSAPSQSGRDPGPGSPFQEDSKSGAHYAGEQDGINNKNTASVSQYDLACFKGPNSG
jgi:hypothetical protein